MPKCTEETLELRVLGALEVRHHSAPLALTGAKPRELLALLALRPNRPVPPEVLSDELWDGAAPPTSASALRVHIGRVRQALEPQKTEGRSARLTLDGAGYTLHIATDELDALRFESLLDRGREANRVGDVAAAEHHLGAALQCWRGPAFADVRDLRAAQPAIARLEQLRLSAVGEFADAKLALGQHHAIVDMLLTEVVRFPLDEGLAGRFMLALYRAGRPAEALRAFSALERRLDDELGTTPSPELRELETDILLQRSHLAFVDRSGSPRVPGERRPQTTTRLIGRRSELAQLVALHDDANTGTRLVLVSGVAGVGKTALVNEYCARARRLGALVLIGSCGIDADEYQPIIELLSAALPVLDETARVGAGRVIDFLRDGSAPSDQHGDDPAADRLRLLQDVAAVLGSVRERPLVLVIEDLHWADQATLRVVRHTLRHADLDLLIVVGTHRSDELAAHQAQSIERLAPPSSTRHLGLDGFDDYEVRAFVRTIAEPHAAAKLITVSATLRDVSAGNPFHIAALARELEESRLLDADPEQLDRSVRDLAPVGVRDLVGRRLARLSEPARRVVDAGAVIGHDIPLDLLTQVCELEPRPVMEAIDELLDHDLIAEAVDRVGVFDFAHALARNAIYVSIPADVRVRLHARVGELLEAYHGTGAPATAAELARHFLAAAPLAGEAKVAHYAEAAGREAAERLALGEAATWYERALACDALPTQIRGRVHLALARAYAGEQHYAQARAACLDGAVYAREAGDHALLADLAVAANGSWATGFESEPGARELLEEALAAIGTADPGRRLRLLGRLATVVHYLDPEREAALGCEVSTIADSLDDDDARAQALLARHLWLTHEPAARRERIAIAQAAMELLGADGAGPVKLQVVRELLTDLLQNGETGRFGLELARYEQLAADVSSPRDLYWSAVLRATQATMRGDLVAGEQLARGAGLRGDELQQRGAGTEFLQRFAIRFQQGRLTELVRAVRAAPDPGSVYRSGSAVSAVVCAETGHTEDALKLARWSVGTDGDEMYRDGFWLGAHALLACVAASTCDRELAARVRAQLAPCADHVVVFGAGAAVLGSTHQWLGLLAGIFEEWDAAVEHLAEAERVAAEIDLPYWHAQAQIDCASALVRRGRGDGPRLRCLASAAVSTAEKNGFGRILARAAELAF